MRRVGCAGSAPRTIAAVAVGRWGAALRALVCVVVVGLAAACASAGGGDGERAQSASGSGTASTAAAERAGSTSASAPPVDPAEAWFTTAASMAGVSASGIAEVDGQLVAATGFGTTVTLWTFDGQRWRQSVSVPTSLPASGPEPAGITVHDVTGDGSADFVVPLAGDGPFTMVVSAHNGSWAAAGFASPDGLLFEVPGLVLRDGALVSSRNDCNPSCARGQVSELRWRFGVDRFVVGAEVVVRPAVLPPGPGDPCDPADGDPDCTDQTILGGFRIVEGWADCVAALGPDAGECHDLDGDGHAGHPDSAGA